MKKRLLLVLALVVVLSLIAAAPVTAQDPNHDRQPPSGDQVMILNAEGDGPLGYYGCEEISWFGTVEIDGKTFGMALYPDFDYVGPGGPLYEYGEYWKIFTGKFKAKDGVLKRCAPGRVVMEGYDEGVWDMGSGLFESFGTVDYAAGYFKWWDGYEVRQDGLIGPGVSVAGIEDAYGFHGTFNTYLP